MMKQTPGTKCTLGSDPNVATDDCFYENGTTRVKFERKRWITHPFPRHSGAGGYNMADDGGADGDGQNAVDGWQEWFAKS